MSEGTFVVGKYSLVVDREGVTVAAPETSDFAKSFAPSALGFADADDLVLALGDVLSHLTQTDLDDADGIFDFAVHDPSAENKVVGTLVISVSDEEDAVEIAGEVARDVSARDLVAAVVSAITKAAAEADADAAATEKT